MRWIKGLLCFGFVGLAVTASIASAQSAPAWRQGIIKSIYADHHNVVLELNVAGPCGETLYNIPRTNTNFQEFVSLMYTAAAGGKTANVYVTSCSGARNILSHGQAIFAQ